MSDLTWTGLIKIKELAKEIADPSVAGKVDSILSALMERLADFLPTATPAELRTGMTKAKEALEALERENGVDEAAPSFTAGRLASAIDLLGYASYQTADEDLLDLEQKQPYAEILSILAQSPLRNADLARRIGKDKARTSKWLSDLRAAGGITSHKRGRESYNAVTPVGRLVVEKGREDTRRIPLEDCSVHDMQAYRRSSYDLNSMPTPRGTTPDEVPLLKNVG